MRMKDIKYRTLEFSRADIDEERREIPASLSSDVPVQRSFGNEVLEHSQQAIDMERARRGLPLLFSHDTDAPIGRVENIRLDGNKLRGMLRFSRNPKASEIWEDVRSGILTDMSVGYRINEYDETDDGIIATNWLPYEASVVAVPADSNVGINREMETETMTDTTETPMGGEDTGQTGDVIDFEAQHKRAIASGEQRGMKAERKRVSGIESSFAMHLERDGVRELKDACIDHGLTIDQANKRLLDFLGGQAEPLGSDFVQTGNRTDVQAGRTEHEKTIEGMTEALLIRGGLADADMKARRGNNEFIAMSMSAMAREWLRRKNVNMAGWDNMRIVGEAMTRDVTETPFQHTVASFPALLADVANKALLRGYEEAPETWRSFCSVGSVSDFKEINRPNLSMFPDLEVVAENGSFPLKAMTDWQEKNQANTKGARFSITRQALVNDDLSAFTVIPRRMGRAAARSVGDEVFTLLNVVQTMNEDSAPWLNDTHINGDHGNVQTAAAPSVTTVDQMRVAMGTQTDPSGATLNIRPSVLLCGLGYEGTASTLRNAQFDPDATDAGNRPNWVAGTFEVVADARIDGWTNSTNWFMIADPAMFDCIEVVFLNGVETPYLEQRDGFTIDGTEYKVRLDFGAAPLDWRTIQLNGTAPA